MDSTESIYLGGEMVNNNQEIIKLGEIVYTEEPEKYNLLGIGTCLAIFMFDNKNQFFAMAHTVLPGASGGLRINERMPAKYTDLAILTMINHFTKKGFHRREILCKIVGGGQIYNDSLSIGSNNIEMAYTMLKKESISLLAEDVGGKTSRSVLSFNKDGTITIRKDGIIFAI